MSLSSSLVFYLYGIFLICGGFLAFAMAGFEARAKTAIITGSACGLLMILIGYFGKTRAKLLTSGRYLAGFFTCLFTYRGYKIIDVPEKYYLFITFIVLVSGSILCLIGQYFTTRAEAQKGYRNKSAAANRKAE